MIEVVALVCLIAAPGNCKNVVLTFATENATPWQCAHYGQMELAKWREANPNWRIAKFRCGRVGQFARA